MLLQQQEALEYRVRLALEDLRVARVEQLPHHLKARVERGRRGGRSRKDRGAEVLQQDRVQLRDRFRGAVVPLHEQLAGALRAGRGDPEGLGERALIVEQDPILAATRQEVKPDADLGEERGVPTELEGLLPRHEPACREVAPVGAEPAGAADPEDHMQVAQAARRLLEIRLEAIRTVLVLLVSLLLLQALRLEERLGFESAAEHRPECVERGAAPAEKARFEQGGLDRDVLRRLLDALVDGAHAMAQFDPDVPEMADEALDRLLVGGRDRSGKQDQNIHIRARIELAATVPAHGHEGERAGQRSGAPQFTQRRIDRNAMAAEIPAGIRLLVVLRPQPGALEGELLAAGRHLAERLRAASRHRSHRMRPLRPRGATGAWAVCPPRP